MPSFGVETAVFHIDKVLLIRREDFGVWCLPGGALEASETLAQAAKRETLEETGIDVELLSLVGVYSRPRWVDGGDHTILFAAQPIGSEPMIRDQEAVAVEYFPPSKLPDRLLWWERQRIADTFDDQTTVVWRQDVAWPFGDMSYQEARPALRSGTVAEQSVIQQLCGVQRYGQEHREIG